ncbi:hypothetical protein FNV43_RR21511 [Rhamnella rubrinervis]|uniref:Uncharacterized protein n=1 Tax=Rhamnella rubrinervis TaxID=2594499 RepID=A0A8K0GRI2_9ROSA|nr:hypothetical protein FNV43_RR21511 [Rhamnella rubrinervis]
MLPHTPTPPWHGNGVCGHPWCDNRPAADAANGGRPEFQKFRDGGIFPKGVAVLGSSCDDGWQCSTEHGTGSHRDIVDTQSVVAFGLGFCSILSPGYRWPGELGLCFEARPLLGQPRNCAVVASPGGLDLMSCSNARQCP